MSSHDEEAAPQQHDTTAGLAKIELHCHLEATLSPEFVDVLAARRADPGLAREAAAAYRPTGDFASYLQGYDASARLLRTTVDFAEAVDRHLATLAQDGVIYTELFWSPMVHLDDGVSVRDQVAGIVAGIEGSTAGIDCRLIPAIDRSRPPALAAELVEALLANRHERMVGVGLDYDEVLGPAAAFVDVFALVRRAGLKATSHAGETAGPESILDSIELLGCQRIDHGYAILADLEAVRHCRDLGMTFTVSSRAAELLDQWGASPARRPVDMWRAGLRISPATDAPAHFGNTITQELETLAQCGLTLAELMTIEEQSVDTTFLDDTDRASLRRSLRRQNRAAASAH